MAMSQTKPGGVRAYCIAKMYYGGEGLPQDYSKAKYYYEAAATKKDKYAYHAKGCFMKDRK